MGGAACAGRMKSTHILSMKVLGRGGRPKSACSPELMRWREQEHQQQVVLS